MNYMFNLENMSSFFYMLNLVYCHEEEKEDSKVWVGFHILVLGLVITCRLTEKFPKYIFNEASCVIDWIRHWRKLEWNNVISPDRSPYDEFRNPLSPSTPPKKQSVFYMINKKFLIITISQLITYVFLLLTYFIYVKFFVFFLFLYWKC